MLPLDEHNLADYLHERGWIAGPARIETLSGGVSNAVLRVDTLERALVVKQSRPQLRTREAWFSDLERVYREQEVMQVLHPLLPAHVPEVLFVDRANFVFAMSAAPANARGWKSLLLEGATDPRLAEEAGALLGSMHEATATNAALVEPFRDATVFVQLRVDPFYRRVQERRPEVAEPIEKLVQHMLTTHEALCHGDYTPKNFLVDSAHLTLVDYETAHFGDPTMDLGLFLCHLLLKAFRRPDRRDEYFDMTRAFWRGYGGTVRYRGLAELQKRGSAHCGACLLARIDGTSPVDYLSDEAVRGKVRRLGCRVLLQEPGTWENVLDQCQAELALP